VPSVWWVLHGYRQLGSRFLRRFHEIAGPDRRILAPEALSRFYLAPGDRPHGEADPVGASWMTRVEREREIQDYVDYLDQAVADPRLDGVGSGSAVRTVLGFSQGVHTAARWVALGQASCHRLILWGAALPPDLPDEAGAVFRDLELILVRGLDDPLRRKDEEAREEGTLEGWGVTWRTLTHPGRHEIDSDLLNRLAGEERSGS
jgi:predicted esterase